MIQATGNNIDVSEYIGIEYVEFDSPQPTFNCWTLVHKILTEKLNANVPSYKQSNGESLSAGYMIACVQDWDSIARDEVQVGDMVYFAIGPMLHCGIMISHDTFCHNLRGRNTVIENINSRAWSNRIEGFYRWSPR